MNRILVTGANSQIGKFLQNIMPEAIFVDINQFDLTRQIDVEKMLHLYSPDTIIHLAARVSGILHNIQYPAEHFYENVLMNTLLIHNAYKNNVKRFIGILSTCIYADTSDHYPLKEEDLFSGPPTETNFSYGYAKRCMAVQIDAYNKQYGLKYNYLIPCNLYSEYEKIGDNSHFIGALIQKIINAQKDHNDSIKLFGTGLPLRQVMYAKDLALILKYCVNNDITESFNVATNEIYSIDEIVNIALKACDAENLHKIYDNTMPDGQYRKDVSTDKFKRIFSDFEPTSLYEGIKKTYNFLTSR